MCERANVCMCVFVCVVGERWRDRGRESREKVHESVERMGGGERERARARVWRCVFVCMGVVGKRWRDREGATVTEKVYTRVEITLSRALRLSMG